MGDEEDAGTVPALMLGDDGSDVAWVDASSIEVASSQSRKSGRGRSCPGPSPNRVMSPFTDPAAGGITTRGRSTA